MNEMMRQWIAKRDALFRNPTPEGARDMLPEPPEGYAKPDVPMAAMHRARLRWLDATDAMLAESKQWLDEHGYGHWRGGLPMTPVERDLKRVRRGLPPLRGVL